MNRTMRGFVTALAVIVAVAIMTSNALAKSTNTTTAAMLATNVTIQNGVGQANATPLQALMLTTEKAVAEKGGIGVAWTEATMQAQNTVEGNLVNNATTATRASPAAATQNNTAKYNMNLGFTSSTKLTLTAAPAEIGGDTGLADVTVTMNTSPPTAKKTN